MGWRIIIFGLTVILLVTLSIDGKPYMDTKTVEGVTCSFAQYKPNEGGGPRGLRLFSCKNKSGNMNVDCTYYGGNPHGCKKYKPDQQSSIKKYYTTLARSAMDDGNPCRPRSITEDLCSLVYPCYEGSCLKEQLFPPRDEL